MAEMTASYSPDDNKLRLYASSRLDAETYARVKAAGFIWAPKQSLFVAPMWTPARADLLEELAGSIGDEDTSLTDRAEERADRFEGYQERRANDAEQARQAVSAIADNIPLGQPILVGHHSERHARRDAERIENGMRRAVKMWETSQYWKARAASAIRHAKYKELPAVRARRIKTIEADRRKRAREMDEARTRIALWSKLDAPGKDGRPCDDDLRRSRALFILNHAGYGWNTWSRLDRGETTPRAAMLEQLQAAGRVIRDARRWIAHFDLRLDYERAMLDEQGATALLAPKPRAKQLPICNYRAPEGIDVENLYNRGEKIHYPQVEMTAAEYARIPKDYKGTRIVERSHRIRTTMQRHSLVCVFLTDSKTHPKPPAGAPPELPQYRFTTPRETVPAPEAMAFNAMRETLRAGVQVVSAPQLFPTPADVARNMVELADIQPGDRVLEPSAGTGTILRAIRDAGIPADVTAIEINAKLAAKLQHHHADVRQADFLTLTPDDLGTFAAIIANPPFERGSDIAHIQHMRRFLAPGGRLVAICADGPRQNEQLRPLAETWDQLQAGTFTGTNVRAVLLTIQAPPATTSEPVQHRVTTSLNLAAAGPAVSNLLDVCETEHDQAQHG